MASPGVRPLAIHTVEAAGAASTEVAVRAGARDALDLVGDAWRVEDWADAVALRLPRGALPAVFREARAAT